MGLKTGWTRKNWVTGKGGIGVEDENQYGDEE